MKQDARTGLWVPDDYAPPPEPVRPNWPPVLNIPDEAKTSHTGAMQSETHGPWKQTVHPWTREVPDHWGHRPEPPRPSVRPPRGTMTRGG